jgi:hypothetical protein
VVFSQVIWLSVLMVVVRQALPLMEVPNATPHSFFANPAGLSSYCRCVTYIRRVLNPHSALPADPSSPSPARLHPPSHLILAPFLLLAPWQTNNEQNLQTANSSTNALRILSRVAQVISQRLEDLRSGIAGICID